MASSQPNAPDLTVRPATRQDAEAIWQWRNDAATRSYSRDRSFIPWEDHIKWFSAVLDDPGSVVFMVTPTSNPGIETADPIAVVRFDRHSKSNADWLVNLNLRPESRGLGLGAHVLFAACEALFHHYGVQVLRAEIYSHNVASRRVFEALGFVSANRGKVADFDTFERPAVPLQKDSDSESP